MEKIKIEKSNMSVPPIAIGCMRLNQLSKTDLEKYIKTTLDLV